MSNSIGSTTQDEAADTTIAAGARRIRLSEWLGNSMWWTAAFLIAVTVAASGIVLFDMRARTIAGYQREAATRGAVLLRKSPATCR
jgi:hypothetical protein